MTVKFYAITLIPEEILEKENTPSNRTSTVLLNQIEYSISNKTCLNGIEYYYRVETEDHLPGSIQAIVEENLERIVRTSFDSKRLTKPLTIKLSLESEEIV